MKTAGVFTGCALIVSALILFISLQGNASDDILKNKFLDHEKQRLWEASKTKLAYDYGICIEHCGGDKPCGMKCEKSYRSRLEMTFKSISHESDEIGGQTDIITHPSCAYCGMDRAKFATSRIFILYDDLSSLGVCSIHCAAVDMAVNIEKEPVSIKTGDYNTGRLIDAEKAVWVIGGEKTGIMTIRAKWAFESEDAADDFIKQYGGEKGTFETAIEASYDDMYRDTRMIRQKRKK
jgi:copper chaperone NosL